MRRGVVRQTQRTISMTGFSSRTNVSRVLTFALQPISFETMPDAGFGKEFAEGSFTFKTTVYVLFLIYHN